MDIPDELVEQLRRHNVVLLVGAGLSAGAGLPGWGALVRPLAERIGYKGDDLLKAAQFYENRAGRQVFLFPVWAASAKLRQASRRKASHRAEFVEPGALPDHC
jgi:NAD-dependent SIR2 family protein deacetylase